MNTFEQLFRAARSDDPEFITNDLLVKGANGEYWNGQVQGKYEWFKVGQAQNLAMLRGLKAIADEFMRINPIALELPGFAELMLDVQEVLKNEKA